MQITTQNEPRVRAFIDIMIHHKVSKEATGMILSMLPNEKKAMNELVDYLKTHQKATEAEILDEAERISETT